MPCDATCSVSELSAEGHKIDSSYGIASSIICTHKNYLLVISGIQISSSGVVLSSVSGQLVVCMLLMARGHRACNATGSVALVVTVLQA